MKFFTFVICLWAGATALAESSDRNASTEKAHVKAEIENWSETDIRPPDSSEVWRFNRSYSRGNDDAGENRNGVFETATVGFNLVAKKDDGKLQLWLVMEPTMSTSEGKGSKAALYYGIKSLSMHTSRVLSEAEQQALYQKELAAQKLQNEEHNARVAKLRGELDTKLAEVQKELGEVNDLMKSIAQKGKDAKTEAEAEIDRLEKLIAKALEARKTPGKDVRAEKLPVEHLRDLIESAKERMEKIKSDNYAEQDTARLTETSALILQRDYRERLRSDSMRTKDKVDVARVHSIGSQLQTRTDFQQLRYENQAIARDLLAGKSVDAKGQKMSGTLYLGEVPIPPAGVYAISGRVGVMNGYDSKTPYHTVRWNVDLAGGTVTGGSAEPLNDRGMVMWKLTDAKAIKPDLTEAPLPANVKLLPPFIKKVEAAPRVVDKPLAPPTRLSISK